MKHLFVFILFLMMHSSVFAVDYYFHPRIGDDKNDGRTADRPFKSLKKIDDLKIIPGDNILLASGEKFDGTLYLKNVSGSRTKPIKISRYGNGLSKNLPIIDSKGYSH